MGYYRNMWVALGFYGKSLKKKKNFFSLSEDKVLNQNTLSRSFPIPQIYEIYRER